MVFHAGAKSVWDHGTSFLLTCTRWRLAKYFCDIVSPFIAKASFSTMLTVNEIGLLLLSLMTYPALASTRAMAHNSTFVSSLGVCKSVFLASLWWLPAYQCGQGVVRFPPSFFFTCVSDSPSRDRWLLLVVFINWAAYVIVSKRFATSMNSFKVTFVFDMPPCQANHW